MDPLDVIRRAIAEHRRVRSDVSSMGGAVNDLEAAFSLQKAHAAWAQSSVDSLLENMGKVKLTVETLTEGLKRHFSFEEQYLPPVFGETMMKALMYEHNQVWSRVSDCQTVLGTDLKGMPQEGLLAHRSALEQKISELTQTLEGHTSREETVFGMIEKALEAEKQAP